MGPPEFSLITTQRSSRNCAIQMFSDLDFNFSQTTKNRISPKYSLHSLHLSPSELKYCPLTNTSPAAFSLRHVKNGGLPGSPPEKAAQNSAQSPRVRPSLRLASPGCGSSSTRLSPSVSPTCCYCLLAEDRGKMKVTQSHVPNPRERMHSSQL